MTTTSETETGPRIVTKDTQTEWKDRETVQFMIPDMKHDFTDEDIEETGETANRIMAHYEQYDDSLWDILQIQLMNVMAMRKLTSFKFTVLNGGRAFVTFKFGEEWTAEEKGV